MPPSCTISAVRPAPKYFSDWKPSLPSSVSSLMRWIATVAASYAA
jgi:hypothetical protein